MALELSSIVFKATTDELDAAVKKIETLGKSVEGLASSLGKLDKESAAANKTQAQTNLLTAKAATETAKAATETAKASAITTKAQDQNTAATERLTKATKEKQSVEQQQEAITRIMSDGYSRGQATILARAEALGEVTTRTAELLKTQRAMQASDPFDKSIGAVTLFENRTRVLTVANDLYQQSLGFTKEQLMDLGREHVRLSEQFKVQGKDMGGLDAEFQKIVQSAQRVTQVENTLATSMKNADKATIDAGKANAYIENELQKVRFALQSNNEELNRSTANSLVKFENNLKRSGLTLDQQKLKIDEYRKAQIELQKTQKANQTDYITRAVGPQITDIIVGLSTGQSPLTVMMQQGGQLRDQFGMMGIAAADMATVMRTAMASMAKSVFDTGKAIGGMLVGGIYDAGKAVTNFSMEITGLNAKFDELKRGYAALGTEGFGKINNLMKIQSVVAGVVAVGLAAIVVQLIAWAVATKQIIEEEGKLSKALNLTGASLGLTKDSAVALASSMKDVGATTSQGIEVITAMAKTGIIGAESIRMVTEAAVLMERYAGVAIEDTVKAFEKMKEKPVESMVELAKATGTVTPETIRLIYELESQGKTAEAASIAMKALADANASAAKRIQEDLHPLQKLYMGIGDGIRYMWNGFKDVARLDFSGDLDAAYLRLKIAQMSPIVNATAIETERTLISQLSAKIRLEGEGVRLRQEQSVASANTAKWEDIKLKNLSSEKKEATEIAKIREAGAKAGILEAEIQEQINAVIAKRPKAKEVKETELQKTIKKALEEHLDIQNKTLGVNKEFNNQILRQKLLLDENLITQEAYESVVNDLVKQQKYYTDGVAAQLKAEKEMAKALDDKLKLEAELLKIQQDQSALYTKNKEGIDQEISSLKLRAELLGKTEKEQEKINESYKTQDTLAKINSKYHKDRLELAQKYMKLLNDGDTVDFSAYDAQVKASLEQQGEEAKLVWSGVAMNAAESMRKEFDAIKSSITDSIVTALFDGGKAGSKKLRDQVVQAFRNKITVVIDAVVNTALTELLSGATGGSTGGAGSVSSAGGILGALSTGKSFVDALSGSMNTAIATSFGKFASSGMGQSLGLSTTAGVHGPVTAAGASPTMLTSTGTMLQGAMASAAGIAAGLALNKAISGGYSAGKGIDNWYKVGTVIASAMNPVLGAIVGAVGGLVNRAFGRKLTETGVQGTFGGEAGFTGQNYKFEEGGWFRSDKTSTSAIDPVLQSGLAEQFNAIKSSVGFMAAMLGQGTGAIESFTASIKLNFKDLSEEESTKLLQEEFSKISESLAGLALGTTQYNRTGETNVETLTRLHTSLLTANSALSVLGGYLFNISLAGADASQSLIDLMGGVQQFTSTMGDYYQNFYTEEERTATATKNLVSEFAKLNIVMPTINESTREWYRSEVKRLGAMDLSVEANAKAYASILGLQGAVNQLAPTFDEIAQSVIDAAEANKEAAKVQAEAQAVTRNAEREQLQLARKSAEDIVSTQRKLLTDLSKSIQSESLAKNGGGSFGFQLTAQEVQLTSKFTSVLESATAGLEELKKLNLGKEFEGIASGIKAVIQSTKELMANELAQSRLAQGDLSGAMSAKMSASKLNYDQFGGTSNFNAGAFNTAYAKEQAQVAKDLISAANQMALTVPNVAGVISGLSSFANSEQIVNDIKQSFIKGVQQASSTTSSYVVRDAVQSLASVFANKNAQETYGNNSVGLPAISNAYNALADTQLTKTVQGKLYMGELSIKYAESIENLNYAFRTGKVTTDELKTSVAYLEKSFGALEEYAVNPVQVAMAGIAASSKVAEAGMQALGFYFGQLTTEASKLAQEARAASEPIAVVTDTVGRMNSAASIFGASANAVIGGFSGMADAVNGVQSAIDRMVESGIVLSEQDRSGIMASAYEQQNLGRSGLTQALTYGSQVRKALLISQGATLASERLTTADASKVQEKLKVDPVFEALGASGIRDAALLLDGLKAFDAGSFEKVFIRLSEALSKNQINEEQYSVLFDTSLNIFDDYDNKIKEVTSAFSVLTKAAESLADQLLIDAGFTSLTGGQTAEESQRQYNEVMLRALSGDVSAAGELSGITQKMLEIAKGQAQNEQDYNRLFGGTIAQLRTVESLSTPALISEPIKVQAQSNEELVNQISLLREELRLSNAQIASNTDKTNKRLQDFQVNGMPTVAFA